LDVGDKAWQEGKAPITRFFTDDGFVRGFPFHHIQKTYEDPVLKALLITYPDGVVEIRGPQVSEFHAQLALGNVDQVRATGKDGIVTVMFYPAVADDDPGDSLLDEDEQPAVAASGEEKG
jgi:hypothetical protein